MIAWHDNIPLLSFAFLRGHCRHCNARISPRYPLVELAVAASWAASVIVFGPTIQGARVAVLCWLLIGLLVTDIETYTLPDALTLPGIAAGLAFSAAVAPAAHQLAALVHAALAAGIFAGLFLAIRALYWFIRRSEGMGLGDVKLIALIASFLLFSHAALALFTAVLAASLFSLTLVARSKANVKSRIPFGAFLAAGGLFSVFYGTRVLDWYLGFFR